MDNWWALFFVYLLGVANGCVLIEWLGRRKHRKSGGQR
jgi:hypothetical protein